MAKEFYRCEKCGNIVGLIHHGGGTLVCCGQPMTHLAPNTTDAAQEKHVPVCQINGDKLHVQVGSTAHPMTTDHWIQWILVTQDGHTQRIELTPSDAPEAIFVINGAKPFIVREYCNLHGLWQAEVK